MGTGLMIMGTGLMNPHGEMIFIEINGLLFLSCFVIAMNYTLLKEPIFSVFWNISGGIFANHHSNTSVCLFLSEFLPESHICVVNSVFLPTLNGFTSHKILVLSLTFQFTLVVSQLCILVRKALREDQQGCLVMLIFYGACQTREFFETNETAPLSGRHSSESEF